MPDDQCIGDVQRRGRYLRALPTANGKVGVIGYCSGGRQAYVVACSLDIDAAVDCYGGRVVATPEDLTPARPISPIDRTPDLALPAARALRRRGRQPVTRADRADRGGAPGERQDLRVPHLRGRGPRVLLGRPAQLPRRGGQGRLEADLGLLRPPSRLTGRAFRPPVPSTRRARRRAPAYERGRGRAATEATRSRAWPCPRARGRCAGSSVWHTQPTNGPPTTVVPSVSSV